MRDKTINRLESPQKNNLIKNSPGSAESRKAAHGSSNSLYPLISPEKGKKFNFNTSEVSESKSMRNIQTQDTKKSSISSYFRKSKKKGKK